MAYADQEMSGNRVIAIIIVALIHVGVGYVLITGLALDVTKQIIERVTTVDVDEPPPPEEEPDEPPPPEEVPDTAPPPIVAPPPPLNISSNPPPIRTQTNIPPPSPPALRIPPPAPAGPPPPPPPPKVNKTREASPKNAAGWYRRIAENYPRRAERDGVEGNVTVRVTVGPDGRVSACSVQNSSGSSELDKAACDGMSRYARYNPAQDQNGNPISDSDVRTISYRIPE